MTTPVVDAIKGKEMRHSSVRSTEHRHSQNIICGLQP